MADAPSRLSACLAGPRAPSAIAGLSCAALDRTLGSPAELTVAFVAGDAVLAGAFQRVTTAGALLFRRGSGGPAVRV
ncbi:MAG TPA: hypothetical protein VIY73_16250, partial [Polyangiaceae bacterium]